jgi:hypothetical protein
VEEVMMMRAWWAVGMLCVTSAGIPPVRAADAFVYEAGTDDISGAEIRSVTIPSLGDDRGAAGSLALVADGTGACLVRLRAREMIDPDVVVDVAKTMLVEVSIRSTSMDKPLTLDWKMPYHDYQRAELTLSPDEAAALFTGETVTLQFNTSGRRLKFRLTGGAADAPAGAGADGLTDAVRRVLELAGPKG